MYTSRFLSFSNRLVQGLAVAMIAGLVILGAGCGSSGSNGGDSVSPPPTPSGLTATSGEGQVALDWPSVSGAEGYNVYRSTASGTVMEGDPLAGAVSKSTYTDGSVTNGTAYYYVVTAVGEGDTESGPTDAVSRTPFASPPDERP
jgi:hypothetical protein